MMAIKTMERHFGDAEYYNIYELLVEKNVEVGVTKVFGSNIKRVKKHFVPVLISTETIEESLEVILNSLDIIEGKF